MGIFDDIDRNHTEPKQRSERLFDYYNKSNRPKVDVARQLLEGWFANYPESGQAELRKRLRADDADFHGAFWELYNHELLTKMGYSLELHPSLEGSPYNPDFLARRDGEEAFFLEATVAMPSDKERARQARMDRLYDTVDAIDSPHFFLRLEDVEGSPDTAPPGRRLGRDLQKWLATLNVEEVAATYQRSDGFDCLPSYTWEHETWKVVFQAIPKSPKHRGEPGRTIGSSSTPVRIIKSDDSIRSSLLGKTKYGHPRLPLIVAVNAVLEIVDDLDIMDALFGKQNMTLMRNADGSFDHHPGRECNGLWHGPRGPRNSRISAVVFARAMTVWQVGALSPSLFHNPWAAKRLDPDLWPLDQHLPNDDNTELILADGCAAREVLQIGRDWPTVN